MFSTSTAKALLKAMKAAVEFERGTARRARVEGVNVAVKTGTAGDRPFNSIIIGILNPVNPKLVFAFELYHGGKCEINGALVAARLQSQIKVIAPQYLD
jgi:cell division protein FtsI/penicillin-binding protein 2